MLQLREVQSSVDYPAVAQGPPVAQALPTRAWSGCLRCAAGWPRGVGTSRSCPGPGRVALAAGGRPRVQGRRSWPPEALIV